MPQEKHAHLVKDSPANQIPAIMKYKENLQKTLEMEKFCWNKPNKDKRHVPKDTGAMPSIRKEISYSIMHITRD